MSRWDRYFGPSGNTPAAAAFVLGIVSLPLFALLIPAILAVLLGLIGRRDAERGAPYAELATRGLWLGIASLVLFVLIFLPKIGEGL